MVTRIEISKSALLHNVGLFRKHAPHSRFMAVVKSNAYGHGLSEVVRVLKGHVDCFGVNSLQEAFRIRDLDLVTPVLVMGRNDIDDYKQLAQLHDELDRRSQERVAANVEFMDRPTTAIRAAPISLTLSTEEDIRTLREHCAHTPVHVKMETGMGRLGTSDEHLQRTLDFLEKHSEILWSGFMSHFANVEDVTEQKYARLQLSRFTGMFSKARKAAGSRGLLFHIASSAPALLLPDSHLDMIRVGISLYGLWASDVTRLSAASVHGVTPELRPVLRWVSQIAYLNRLPAGSFVGYGCAHRVVADTLVAVLPVGYYEGYSRSLSDLSRVLIRGRRARILGRVCMNMVMADVTHIPDANVGDEAVLLGKMGDEVVSAEELAGLMGTINYEVVTGIHDSLPRVLVH